MNIVLIPLKKKTFWRFICMIDVVYLVNRISNYIHSSLSKSL